VSGSGTAAGAADVPKVEEAMKIEEAFAPTVKLDPAGKASEFVTSSEPAATIVPPV